MSEPGSGAAPKNAVHSGRLSHSEAVTFAREQDKRRAGRQKRARIAEECRANVERPAWMQNRDLLPTKSVAQMVKDLESKK